VSEASEDGGTDNDEASLSAYGNAVDVIVRVPTLMGLAVGAFAAAVVWAWRRLSRRSAAAHS
jgi:hypothetical protein